MNKKWTRRGLEEIASKYIQYPVVSYDGIYELRVDIKYLVDNRVAYFPMYLDDWDGKQPLKIWFR